MLQNIVFVCMVCMVIIASGCVSGQFLELAKTSPIPLDGKIQYVIKTLQEAPDNEEAKSLLEKFYSDSIEEHLQVSGGLARNNQYFKAIGELDKVAVLNKSVSGFLGKSLLRRITGDRSALVTQAGQYYFAEGEKAQNKGDAREAAKNFRIAALYAPGYNDVEERYKSAAQQGTIRICILPFEVKEEGLQTLGEEMSNEVLASAGEMNPEFLEFVNRSRMEQLAQERNLSLPDIMTPEDIAKAGQTIPADVMVFGRIDNIYAEEGEWFSDTYRDDAKRQDPNTLQFYVISAFVTKYYKTNIIRVKASYREVDVKTGKVGNSKRYEREQKSSYEYATFSGDENALSPQSRQLLGTPKGEPQNPELMLQDLIGQISKEMGVDLFRAHKK